MVNDNDRPIKAQKNNEDQIKPKKSVRDSSPKRNPFDEQPIKPMKQNYDDMNDA